jgi:hypothetical protein
MPGLLKRVVLAWSVLLLSGFAAAQEKPAAEPLPPPRPIPSVIVLPEAAAPVFYRSSRYDVWQFYGVDRWGGFRRRVIYSPHGGYYLDNGAPFPWAPLYQREFIR